MLGHAGKADDLDGECRIVSVAVSPGWMIGAAPAAATFEATSTSWGCPRGADPTQEARCDRHGRDDAENEH